jgi:hypothetical protein
MLENKQRVAVWLFDQWARALLAAPPPAADDQSRWVAIGSLVDSAPQGIWLNSGRIEEWKSDGKTRVAWKFTPPTLLIRWEAIITVQVVEGDEKEIGFKIDR